MGSVCCTSARAGDLAEAGEGWSIERTGPLTFRTRHGALSPPPLSSHWERKAYFSEIGSSHNCISLHRTSSSCSRICRSNSNGSDNRGNASLDRPDRADGLLAIFNNPSASLRCSSRSYDQGANPVAIPSEPVLRMSAAAAAAAASGSSEEGAGLSAASLSFDMASQQELSEASESVFESTQMQAFSKLGLPTSNITAQSRQIINPPSILESSSYEKMLLGFDSYQQMMRDSLDMPLSLSNKQQLPGPWKMPGFAELMESSGPRSSRWSDSLGISSANMSAEVNHEEAGSAFYIRSAAPTRQHELSAAFSEVEAHKCGLCGKAICQKSMWSLSRAVGSRDLPVVGVLDCGHVYHAECLDQATPLMQAHDPPCPKCEDRGRAAERRKAQEEEGHGKMMKKTSGPSMDRVSVKWEPSKVGGSTDDLEPPASRSYQPVWNHNSWSESFPKKEVLPSVCAHGADERTGSPSTKSFPKKQFSFRGKLSREASSSSSTSGGGPKRPGYPARVSPENL